MRVVPDDERCFHPANTLVLFKAYFVGVHKDPALIEPLCRATEFELVSVVL